MKTVGEIVEPQKGHMLSTLLENVQLSLRTSNSLTTLWTSDKPLCIVFCLTVFIKTYLLVFICFKKMLYLLDTDLNFMFF